MRHRFRFLMLICSVLLCGCGQTIIVNRAVKPVPPALSSTQDPPDAKPKSTDAAASERVERVKGMPFYIKKAGCKHHTSWLQPIYTITLTITFTPEKPSGDVKVLFPAYSISQTVTMPLWLYDSDDAQQLRGLLSKVRPAPPKTPQERADQEKLLQDIAEKWDDLVSEVTQLNYRPFGLNENKLSICEQDANHQDLPNCDAKQVVKIENVTEPELYVDYSTPYYYNSSKPLIGSSQASFKQAADGTLSEGSAQVETKTLQSFLDLFPVKDLVSTAAGVAKSAAKIMNYDVGPPETAGTYKFELTSSVKVYKHTHTARVDSRSPPCTPSTDDVIGSIAYNLTIDEVAQTADKKTADANAISVSGTIKLPKTPDKNAESEKPK